MRYADLFRLKPSQIVLLITALAGAFLLGRCSSPESVKKPLHLEQQAPSELAEQEEIRFDEQCRDIRLDAQSCVSPFFYSAEGGTIICAAPEQKESLPRPV
ncbi:MAG: hypothetical protein D3925_10015, partial [Candidatus Electrothrix sp. AR5]|nr:hypothetical protein [Candidatus Electrothrix sp. AR5]